MRKRFIVMIIIITVFVSIMAAWRFRKLSLSDVISFDTDAITDASASAKISDFENNEIRTYLLDDAHMEEFSKLLDSSEYRRDYRNMLPWGVHSVSSGKNYDGRL